MNLVDIIENELDFRGCFRSVCPIMDDVGMWALLSVSLSVFGPVATYFFNE